MAAIAGSLLSSPVPAADQLLKETVCALTGPVGSVLARDDGGFVISGGGLIHFINVEDNVFGQLDGTVTRFRPDGTLDLGFGCKATPPSYVDVFKNHLVAGPAGGFLMVGPFRLVEGHSMPGFALLSASGLLDTNFLPWRGESNLPIVPQPISLRGAALNSNGLVVVPRLEKTGWNICQLAPDGSVETVQPMTLSGPDASAIFAALFDDRGFSLPRSIEKDPGAAADVFRWVFGALPLELYRYAVRLPDGGVLMLVRDNGKGRLMRFDRDWNPDFTYTNTLRAKGYLSLAAQPDGKVLVTRASELHDLSRRSIGSVVRLNVDGSIDESFRCDTDERVMCLAVQRDGRVVIGGFFRTVNGIESPFLARLHSDGTLDEAFRRHFSTVRDMLGGHRLRVASLEPQGDSPAPGSAVSPPSQVPNVPEESLVLITGLDVAANVATVRFQGSRQRSYILQATDSLQQPAWVNVSTNLTDDAGRGVFRDTAAGASSMRFYRIASPSGARTR